MNKPGDCDVIRKAIEHGEGEPDTYFENGRLVCEGYQKGYLDDEPCEGCIECVYNECYED